MSTGNIGLDILLDQIHQSIISKSNDGDSLLLKRYPTLSDKEAKEIYALLEASYAGSKPNAELVLTSPPSFDIQTKATKTVVKAMIENAQSSILITGYSLSDYFSELIDVIIRKSQAGVFVKFFVNNIDSQDKFERLRAYKSRFLRIYNYPKQEDNMAALHAKVISVDGKETLITSANLSYHGQEANIELGTRISSEVIAKQIDDVFTKLLFKKIFIEV